MTPATAAAPATAVSRGFEVDFLPAAPRLVAQMRRITATHLHAWGLKMLVDSATLVVSELITNAIRHRHNHGAVNLTVRRCAQVLCIEVADGNPAPARRRSANESDESGRGLEIVDALSQDWGVSSDGTTTWAVLRLPIQEA